MGARANDHEDLIWLPALRLSFARSLSFYNGSEEGKTKNKKKKKDSLSSGQHTAVTENEIWNDDACVWNEPMIAVSQIIKKGSRSKPWRAFLPTSSVYFWAWRKTSVCSRRNKCNIYLRLPPVWIVGSVQEVLNQKWNGPTPSLKVAYYGQF